MYHKIVGLKRHTHRTDDKPVHTEHQRIVISPRSLDFGFRINTQPRALQFLLRCALRAPWTAHRHGTRTHTLCTRPICSTMVQCNQCKARESPGVPSMRLCGGCFNVSYCDATCQKADRKAHREVCNELKARREAHNAAPPTLVGGVAGLNAAALRRAANAGDAGAMVELASCYSAGVGGVSMNLVEAFRWCLRAVEVPAPSAVAYYNLAVCYYFGHGTRKDPVEAVRLNTIAAEMGHTHAQFNLGICLQRGEGTLYNPAGAFTWFKRAADAGLAEAEFKVAFALENGLGIEEDKALGVVYYRRSADKGDANAMCNLGCCYVNGAGVPRDPSLAVLWLKRAIDAGYSDAVKNLAVLAATLSPSEVDAMSAGVLRALLDGVGMRVPPGAGKMALEAIVLAIIEDYEEGAGEDT